MPAIPLVDIEVPLFDTGYNFRFAEADSSTTLGQFGFQFPQQQPEGLGGTNQSYAGAFFPGYNTLGSPMTPTPQNFSLQQHADTPYAITGVSDLPDFDLWGFDGTNFLQITWDGPSGAIQAKLTSWPGAIDYSPAGFVTLITSSALPFGPSISPGGLFPVIFSDGSKGFVLWGVYGDPGSAALLPIPLDLTTPVSWVTDPSPLLPFGPPTITAPFSMHNFAGDFSAAPTLTVWTVSFDVTLPTAMNVVWTLFASGDLSTDAVNGLLPEGWFGEGGFYYTPLGFFGIDWSSGDNTGCWYCRYDCTAYGRITFTMPDASLGPSSDPSVFWVNQFQGSAPSIATTQFQFYPNWDLAGVVWWIRVPLQAGGDYVLEPLTGEVYTSLGTPAAGGSIFGTFVGVVKAGQMSGGTK